MDPHCAMRSFKNGKLIIRFLMNTTLEANFCVSRAELPGSTLMSIVIYAWTRLTSQNSIDIVITKKATKPLKSLLKWRRRKKESNNLDDIKKIHRGVRWDPTLSKSPVSPTKLRQYQDTPRPTEESLPDEKSEVDSVKAI